MASLALARTSAHRCGGRHRPLRLGLVRTTSSGNAALNTGLLKNSMHPHCSGGLMTAEGVKISRSPAVIDRRYS